MFTVGSSIEQTGIENGDEGLPDPQPSFSPQPEGARQSQSEKNLAMAYQRGYESTENVVQLHTIELNRQIKQLKEQVKNLQQELNEKRDEKEALQ